MFLRLFILLSVVFSSASFAQPKENRVALVVGNSAYKSAPLRNPTNDAKDMAAKLKGMGFTVIERSNLSVKQIGSTLREFRTYGLLGLRDCLINCFDNWLWVLKMHNFY
jgi:hypothetical protein